MDDIRCIAARNLLPAVGFGGEVDDALVEILREHASARNSRIQRADPVPRSFRTSAVQPQPSFGAGSSVPASTLASTGGISPASADTVPSAIPASAGGIIPPTRGLSGGPSP